MKNSKEKGTGDIQNRFSIGNKEKIKMPNHIRNKLKFKGNCLKIKSLLKCIADKEIGIGSIDFNKIIPMPDSIECSNGDEMNFVRI